MNKTLLLCEGPITHKLKAFAEYLSEQVDPPFQKVMANNVQFWLEVNKFKVSLGVVVKRSETRHWRSKVIYYDNGFSPKPTITKCKDDF